MPIEVRGPSGWDTYYDPEIYTSSGWTDINFGEIYTAEGWKYFYARINAVAPAITLNSRTTTSITVNVTHPNVDANIIRVFIYRVGDQANGQYKPSGLGTTSPVSSTFQSTGLTMNTSYTFRAYAEYFDGNGNLITTSAVTEETFTTVNINTVAPTLSLDSRSTSAITLNVTHPGASGAYNVRVAVYRVGNEIGTEYKPSTSGTTSSITSTFTQTGLAQNTSYTFRAYAEYRDISTLDLLATSSTTQLVQATSNYNLWTASNPTGSTGYEEISSTYYGTLTLTSTANPQYSINGSTSRIIFEITNFGIGTYTADSIALTNNDTLQSRSVTFSKNNNTGGIGLPLGTTWICRARVYYPTIDEFGPWSGYSTFTLPNWTLKTIPSNSTWAHMRNNSTYFDGFSSFATSIKSANESSLYASDGDSSTQWISDPYELQQQQTNQNRSINTISTGFGVAQYTTSSSHNIVTGVNGTVDISSITYYGSKTYTDATFIVIEISTTGQPAPGGSATIFGSGIPGVDGVSRSIQNTSVSGTTRSVRFLRGSATANQIGNSGRLVMFSGGTVGGVTVGSLGGSGQLTRVDSSTFYRTETSQPSPALGQSECTGDVTYPVTELVQVPKGSGSEILTLWASPNLPAGAVRNARLLNIYYQQGPFSTPARSISVNGVVTTVGSVSANATTTTSTSAIAPDRSSSNGSGDGWYITVNQDRSLNSGLYYASVKEVQLRYSYEVIE